MAGLLWYRSYMDSLANTNGYYPDIRAGHADRVAELTLRVPYLIREVPSGYNQLELSQIIGGTMVVEGSLQSVEATAHVSVGFNLFDKTAIDDGFIDNDTGAVAGTSTSKHSDYIPVIGGMDYYIKSDATSGRWGTWYDASKNYISGWSGAGIRTAPSNAKYMRMTAVYNGNGNPDTMCINISDPDKNGTYEPYTENICPLANITLRGMLKTDANGNLYYDGDTYEWDGTVTRNYGTRAYQAGDESLTDAITDGTNTVYKLTTPVTESAAPYTATQTVEEGGTVQFVTSNSIPVGNVSIYRRV